MQTTAGFVREDRVVNKGSNRHRPTALVCLKRPHNGAMPFMTSAYFTDSVVLEDKPDSIVDLQDSLESTLKNYRVTLKRYGIEILYDDLPEVQADPEKVMAFFKLVIGRVVHYTRHNSPVVYLDGSSDRAGAYQLVIRADRSKSEKLLLVGHFSQPAEVSKAEDQARSASTQ